MWDEGELPEGLGLLGNPSLRSLVEDLLSWERVPLFDLKTKSLRPLWRVEAAHGFVIVTFDLPYVKKKDVHLTATATSLEMEAKMRRPVTIRPGGAIQRAVVFRSYAARIALPASVVPEKAEATFRNGFLKVKIPLAKRGSRLKIA